MVVIITILAFILIAGVIARLVDKHEACEREEYHNAFTSVQQQAMFNIHVVPFANPQDSFERGWNDGIKDLETRHLINKSWRN